MVPVSRKTYAFDINEANETGVPKFHLSTDWAVDFELDDLSPRSMKKLVDRMAEDAEYTLHFANKSHRRTTEGDLWFDTCDDDCVTE